MLCARPGVAAVMVPKADRVEHIDAIRQHVKRGTPILPIVETAAGIWHVEQLALAAGVRRLVFGALDLSVDLRVAGDEESLLYCRSRVVLVSRVAGLEPPVDAPSTTFVDSGLLSGASYSYTIRAHGTSGKSARSNSASAIAP